MLSEDLEGRDGGGEREAQEGGIVCTQKLIPIMAQQKLSHRCEVITQFKRERKYKFSFAPIISSKPNQKHLGFYCFFLGGSPWQAWGHHLGTKVVLPGPPVLLEFGHKIILAQYLILLCYMTKSSFFQLWARAGYR